MAAVMPSIPCDAPRALFAAAASMLDRLALTLLMDALARLASTSTTSSSLLSAMLVQLLAIQGVAFVCEQDEGSELIRPDLVQADSDAHLQRGLEIDRTAQQQTRLGRLRRVQFVQRAMVATAAIVGSVRAEAGIAEFFAPQRPMNQKSQGGFFGPLPCGQFGCEGSSKALSSASMAAFTATAWWMIGASPA